MTVRRQQQRSQFTTVTRVRRTTEEMQILYREWQGVLIRLGLSVGLLVLALMLAARFG